MFCLNFYHKLHSFEFLPVLLFKYLSFIFHFSFIFLIQSRLLFFYKFVSFLLPWHHIILVVLSFVNFIDRIAHICLAIFCKWIRHWHLWFSCSLSLVLVICADGPLCICIAHIIFWIVKIFLGWTTNVQILFISVQISLGRYSPFANWYLNLLSCYFFGSSSFKSLSFCFMLQTRSRASVHLCQQLLLRFVNHTSGHCLKYNLLKTQLIFNL